jgi:tetratricopeptide (TPR) repeat protein
MQEAVPLSRKLNDKPTLAWALDIQGKWELFRNNDPSGLALLEEALALSKEISDHWLIGIIQIHLADEAKYLRNNLTAARAFLENGLKELRLAGDKRLISLGLNSLGQIALAQSNPKEALTLFQESQICSQEIDDKGNFNASFLLLSDVYLFLEDYHLAEQSALRAHGLSKELNHRRTIWESVARLGIINWAQGNVFSCAEKFRESLMLAKQMDDPSYVADSLSHVGISLRLEGNFSEAKDKFNQVLKIYKDVNQKSGYCLCLENLGMLAIDQGQAERGTHLLGARETLRTSTFVEDSFPFMVRERERYIAKAREQLGEEIFQKAWQAGKEMSIEEAIQSAMSESNE